MAGDKCAVREMLGENTPRELVREGKVGVLTA